MDTEQLLKRMELTNPHNKGICEFGVLTSIAFNLEQNFKLKFLSCSFELVIVLRVSQWSTYRSLRKGNLEIR